MSSIQNQFHLVGSLHSGPEVKRTANNTTYVQALFAVDPWAESTKDKMSARGASKQVDIIRVSFYGPECRKALDMAATHDTFIIEGTIAGREYRNQADGTTGYMTYLNGQELTNLSEQERRRHSGYQPSGQNIHNSGQQGYGQQNGYRNPQQGYGGMPQQNYVQPGQNPVRNTQQTGRQGCGQNSAQNSQQNAAYSGFGNSGNMEVPF